MAIAHALQLEAARRRAVPIRFNFVASAKFELAQPIHCHLRAFLLLIRYVALWHGTLTPCPSPFTFDLWPWTCVVDRLCHSRTLYEIWAKWNDLQQSYCDLNIWPYDLEHVSHAPLCCRIVCTKFELSQAIRSWNMTIFHANTSCHAMSLTFDPLTWTFVVGRVSRGQYT